MKTIMYNCLSGLKQLHGAGLVHRDIKPCNILIDCECQVKIADYGLARCVDRKRSMSPHVVTRSYRPPEVALGQNYDETVDIWSLGVVFYELMKSTFFKKTNMNIE